MESNLKDYADRCVFIQPKKMRNGWIMILEGLGALSFFALILLLAFL